MGEDPEEGREREGKGRLPGQQPPVQDREGGAWLGPSGRALLRTNHPSLPRLQISADFSCSGLLEGRGHSSPLPHVCLVPGNSPERGKDPSGICCSEKQQQKKSPGGGMVPQSQGTAVPLGSDTWC